VWWSCGCARRRGKKRYSEQIEQTEQNYLTQPSIAIKEKVVIPRTALAVRPGIHNPQLQNNANVI
jgi:hypothetical protein